MYQVNSHNCHFCSIQISKITKYIVRVLKYLHFSYCVFFFPWKKSIILFHLSSNKITFFRYTSLCIHISTLLGSKVVHIQRISGWKSSPKQTQVSQVSSTTKNIIYVSFNKKHMVPTMSGQKTVSKSDSGLSIGK